MIKLPAFTFLNAPPRSGKSTLATLLEQQDHGLVRVSFAEPLRSALIALFYPEDIGDAPMRNFRDPTVKAQGIPVAPSWTNEQFLIDLGTWLQSKTNEYLLGDIAKRHVEKLSDYYSRFVFDDARLVGDVAPFINAYGASECIVIHLDRSGAVWRPGDVGGWLANLPGIQHARLINNTEPEYMLRQLELLLGGTAAQPQRPSTAPAPTIGDL